MPARPARRAGAGDAPAALAFASTPVVLPVLLTGCYCDDLFKGMALNRTRHTLLGRSVPLLRLDVYRHQYYHAFAPLPERWQAPVNARLEARHPGCVEGQAPASWRAVEAMRLRPMAREADYAGRMVLLRSVPFDLVTLDNDVLDVWMRMPAPEKLDGLAFERAVARLTPAHAAGVPTVHYASAMGGSRWTRLRDFLQGVTARKLRRALGWDERYGLVDTPGPVDTPGSWSDQGAVIRRSEVLAGLWHGMSAPIRAQLGDLAGYDPWARDLQEWGRTDPFVLWRLVTLGLWLEGRRGR